MSAVCELTQCRGLLLIEVDRSGTTRVSCPRCDRRRAGLCRDCPRPVYGTVGKAVRCAEHARRRLLENGARHRADDDVKRRISKRDRTRYRTDEAYAERRRAVRRAWGKKNVAKVKAARRRLLLSEGSSRETYLATQRRHNTDPKRVKAKRAAALARYYKLNPTRPDPRCAGCQKRIAFSGVGKPAKWCDGCCTSAEMQRRRKLGRSIKTIDEQLRGVA